MELYAITHCWYDEGCEDSLTIPYQKVVGIFREEQLKGAFQEIIEFFASMEKGVKTLKPPDKNGGYFLEFEGGTDSFYSGRYTVGELDL